MTATAKVLDLSKKRDELKAAGKPNEELRDQIVALKQKLKKLPADAKAERTKIEEQISLLEKKRARSPELEATMKALGDARAEAYQAGLDAFVATLAEVSDEQLEALHHDLTRQRSELKWRVTAVAQLRSSRARIAANRSLMKDLSADEILASLTPEQRADLAKASK